MFTLSSGKCTVRMQAQGGRILSVRNESSGREWLWARDGDPVSYVKSWGGQPPARPMFGIDECIPTVAPCVFGEEDYPDHGTAWTREWKIDEQSSGRLIAAETTLNDRGLKLRRELTIYDLTVRLQYTLHNAGLSAEPFLWAFHPLLKWDAGDYIELNPAVRQAIIGAYHSNLIRPRSIVSWPVARSGIALDRGVFEAGGTGSAKLFIGPESGGTAALVHPLTSEKLVLHWSTEENPWLGIWICSGARNGYRTVALEPTNAPYDALSDACGDRSAAVLPPSGSRTWDLSLTLTSPKPCSTAASARTIIS